MSPDALKILSENTKVPPFILELIINNIPVSLRVESNILVYEIGGFYKSGTVSIWRKFCALETEEYIAKDRYKEQSFSTFEDLVYLNASWWESSKDRHDGWEQPDPRWAPLLLKHGYIEEVPAEPIVTKYRPRRVT